MTSGYQVVGRFVNAGSRTDAREAREVSSS